MYVFNPPTRIPTNVHFRLPDKFRKKQRTAWSDPNRLGQEVDCFLEGPSFDREGNLYFVDIPFGRIFRLSPKGDCELVVQYDGWPNGLKIHKDGRIYIADYKRGLLSLDAKRGTVQPILATRNSESFKGLNDLIFAANGDCYFTDQGQTGLHDPTGRVYRLTQSGKLDCLLSTVPSPNGIVLNKAENRLYVAVTRQNGVWRAPLMSDGSVAKVGIYIQLSGGWGGPDGLALDAEGRLFIAHVGMGAVWVVDALGEPVYRIRTSAEPHTTNMAFGGKDNRTLFITESGSGSILKAELDVPGKPMFSHQ
jgi:gluconolactonase